MKRKLDAVGCPCDAVATYAACCGCYIDGLAIAATALALMRSRYTAYVLENPDYLLATWHPSTRPTQLCFDPPTPRWLGLDVKATLQQDADHATVEFVARLRIGGRAQRLHERSRFVRANGHWLYVAGERVG